jgi:large subunit ribosomal protein L16|nr:ribosomal protein L16 [Blastocystis sp. subtype 2]APC25027.1 ribosomal protein L16 [Blastocystis sp. subtype 2]
MLLKPKKFKNFKVKKNRLHGLNYNTKNLTKGNYGLKALDYARLTSKQIETTYMAINKILQKQAKVYINIFPDTPITSKSIASRMGKGKGDIKNWVCLIKPGKILFEISDVSEDIAKKALNYGISKLTINCKIVKFNKFN